MLTNPVSSQSVSSLAAAITGRSTSFFASDLAKFENDDQLTQTGAFPLNSLGVQCIVYQVPAARAPQALIDTLTADPS